ncbi:MAG TPA: hypothetical protein VLF91_04490 [Candidatus Saccharimonadales bacterium]|nr:hypothetical protein [Candidatus Saccharimonadales bacterium]
MTRTNESGSHIIGISLAIVVLALVAFAGYRVVSRGGTTAPAKQTAAVSQPAAISNKADLQQAAQSLDSSGSDVNSSLNTDSLNSDLNDML